MKKVRKSLALDVIDCNESARVMPPKPMPKISPKVRISIHTYTYRKSIISCVNFDMSD